MQRMKQVILLTLLTAFLAGCPVSPEPTPVPEKYVDAADAPAAYWIYVPSYYTADRTWPLMITLHGTHGWDSSHKQALEWRGMAERHGFIVVAPELRSVQGILPVINDLWQKDLQRDEKNILWILQAVSKKYRIDPNVVLLTGFSAGGFPMYYTGLRHPDKFQMLIARACNSDLGIFEGIRVTLAARQMPIQIIWGKDDLAPIRQQSWAAYRWLREHRFFETQKHQISGGHLRQPELVYRLWRHYLPDTYKR